MKYIKTGAAHIELDDAVDIGRHRTRNWERRTKAFFDFGGALIALVLFSPLFLIVAVLIKFDSSGPVFFRQTRVGVNGKPFRIFKFRTMRTLEDGATIRQATRDDDRVTGVGRWLRSTSVDELPQLLNVLLGDMSLVGPRPHALAHDSHYGSVISGYALRHQVKPGLTGWAQVCGYRGETATEDLMVKRVEHDLWYIENWSIGLDSKIIGRTIGVLIRPQNAY